MREEKYMNKDQFHDYILNNFTMDGTSLRLVHNILDYVAVQGCCYEDQQALLSALLDGIGLTEEEIGMVGCERRLDQPKEPSRIEIPAGENTYLVAEANPDADYHEIFIGLEYRKGQVCTWMQDIAIVGQKYKYPEGSDKPTPTPRQFSVKVYADSELEDFTEDVLITQRDVE